MVVRRRSPYFTALLDIDGEILICVSSSLLYFFLAGIFDIALLRKSLGNVVVLDSLSCLFLHEKLPCV